MFCDRVVIESSGKLQRNEMTRNVARAAEREEWERVQLLVEEGESVNATVWGSFTALHFAVGHENADICSFLLSRGANVTMASIDGHTPLHIAACCHHADICQLLVDHKADVTCVNKEGDTPLLIALASMHYLHDIPAVCRPLITNESVNVADLHGNCAVHIAGRNGFVLNVQLLVDCGADVNALNECGQTPLHTAAGGEEDCPELCSILLKHNAKIDAVDRDGNQPLHLVCKRGHTSTSCSLLFHGADVNALNEYGQTPLHTAAGGEEDNPELCSNLLKYDAKIDAVDKDGNQPLHLAWKQRHSKACRLLLSNGANANAWTKDGETLLHTAAGGEEDCPRLCSILLKHKAKIDAVDRDGNQPLHLACKRGHTSTSLFLLSHRADVNALNEYGQTPLHTAAGGEEDNPDLCSNLLKHDAKIDAVDKDGNQPLHLAWKQRHSKACRLLLSNGANANAWTKDGETLLHTAAGGEEDCPRLCSILLKHKAKIDAVDRDGNQPLHLACKRGHTSTSLFLLSHRADVNALNEYGQTPLHTAAGGEEDNPELCSNLLKHDAKIDAVDRDGNQPLHLACKRGHTSTSCSLLSHGADVNALNEYGQTPLHTAAGGEEDNHELCSNLLKHDAKIDAVDRDGNQPLHLAWKQMHSKACRLLLSNGANANAWTKDGETLLHTAAGGEEDCPRLCSILLKHKAKIDAVDRDGNQPLHLACKRGHTSASLFLLSHGADVNALNEYGQTPLHTAAGGEEDNPELCSNLLKRDAKIDAVDKDGNQPLHLACEAGLTSTVQYLLHCNADVFSKNNFHQTVLYKAVCSKRDCFEVCEMLIAKGSPVNVTDSNGHTSLQLACQKGHMTTADVLVKSDADCNVLNVFGETLLHLACKSRVECVELCDKLISHGVNPHVADREGNLPLHVALKNRLSKTFCYLFQKSGDAVLDDLQKANIDKEDLMAIFSSAHEADNINNCRHILEFSAKLDPSSRLCLREANCHTTTGYSLIQRAVEQQNIAICLHLIACGASVNSDIPYSPQGRTLKEPPYTWQ